MENKTSLYIISNGSSEIYPNNTLTHFTNRLPAPIDLEGAEKYEIAVENVGFSTVFRNIQLPETYFFPSFILTNTIRVDEQPIDGQCVFEGKDIEVCLKPKPFTISLEMEKSIKRLFIQLRENKSLKFTLDEEEPLSKVKPIFNKNLPFYYFGNFEEKYYTEDDLTNYFNQINERFDVKLTVKNGFLEFERSFGGNPYHVLIHPSMMETFGFQSDILLEHLEHMYTLSSFDPSEMLPNKKIWKKNVIDHMMNYNGQLYYKFYVGNVSDVLKATKSPTSKTKDNFPQVVKVVSNNISPQIFNSSYSNDNMYHY